MADTKKSTKKMKTLQKEETEQEDSAAAASPSPPAAGKKNEPADDEQEEAVGAPAAADESATESSSDILTSQSFASLGVCDALLDACQALEWKTATQIQASVLPEAFTGRDIIGLAETGSGKTGGKHEQEQEASLVCFTINL
jgi:hypothetical protein